MVRLGGYASGSPTRRFRSESARAGGEAPIDQYARVPQFECFSSPAVPVVIRGGYMSVLMAARSALICHSRVVAAVA